MTTRGGALTACSSLFRLEDEHGEWREGNGERVAVLLIGHGDRFGAAVVAEVAAAVERGIAVQELAPVAAARHADAVIVPRNGREVANHEQRRHALAGLAQEREHALLPVAALHPAEPIGREVARM